MPSACRSPWWTYLCQTQGRSLSKVKWPQKGVECNISNKLVKERWMTETQAKRTSFPQSAKPSRRHEPLMLSAAKASRRLTSKARTASLVLPSGLHQGSGLSDRLDKSYSEILPRGNGDWVAVEARVGSSPPIPLWM
jgi:hypothetical protein